MQFVRKQRRGFSLAEVILAIAVVGIMSGTGVGLVINNLEKGRRSTAQQDIRAIMQATESFHANNFLYPGYRKIGNAVEANGNNVHYLYSSNAQGNNPNGIAAGYNGDAMANYFLTNTGEYANDYTNWKGPYISELRVDPWSRNYILWTVPFWCADRQPGAAEQGNTANAWILSAGPDPAITTFPVTANIANAGTSDAPDIGQKIYATTCTN